MYVGTPTKKKKGFSHKSDKNVGLIKLLLRWFFVVFSSTFGRPLIGYLLPLIKYVYIVHVQYNNNYYYYYNIMGSKLHAQIHVHVHVSVITVVKELSFLNKIQIYAYRKCLGYTIRH